MTFTFRPALTSEAKPLIGLYSESGCGKTYSALLLARGFAGSSGRIGMIETEGGRGEAYADLIPGSYDVLPIRGNYAPAEYGLAIDAAEKAGLGALIIDSASHEWEGVGGVLALAAANQAAGKKGVLVWQQPKMEHQRHFMGRLISTPIPLVIVCMRAKYPMVEKIVDGKKDWARSDKLEPKQSEDILFEMFCHGWIDREHNFRGTKYTRPDWRDIIRDGERISIDSGRRLAEWARGGAAKPTSTPPADRKADVLAEIKGALTGLPDNAAKSAVCAKVLGVKTWAEVERLPVDVLEGALIPVSVGGPSKIEAEGIKYKEAHPTAVES